MVAVTVIAAPAALAVASKGSKVVIMVSEEGWWKKAHTPKKSLGLKDDWER